MKRTNLASLVLALGLIFGVNAKATFCVLCWVPDGQVANTDNLQYQLTGIPLSEIGSFNSLTDAFRMTGPITYETPTAPSDLTGGYTAEFIFPNLSPGTYVISSYLNATVSSSLPSSTAVLKSASVTTEFFDISNNLLATVVASNGTLSAGPVTSTPFVVPSTSFSGLDHIDQIFSASFTGVQAGETLTVNFPNTSAVGTSGAIPEPSTLLLVGVVVVFIGWHSASRMRAADRDSGIVQG